MSERAPVHGGLRRRGARVLAAVAVAGALAGAAQAGDLFRWTQRGGTPAYGDHIPDDVDPARTPVTRTAMPGGEHAPVARLRLETRGETIEAWADNHLAGPIEVMLQPVRGGGAQADPPLPARATVPAYQRRLVARLPAQAGVELRLDVVPGDPGARPADVEYGYPLRTGRLRVEQGYGGAYSHHDDQNLHAVDFAAEIGTPVLAARAGRVMEVEADYDRAGPSADAFAGRANFVRIVHEDGTMALYAHLKPDGALVRVGQHVGKGEVIGLSGNTGYTTGPHLHFAVQANRGMRLVSIPFRMFGPQGILRFSAPKRDAPR